MLRQGKENDLLIRSYFIITMKDTLNKFTKLQQISRIDQLLY